MDISAELSETQIRCSRCGKPIYGRKHIRIGRNLYHMLCGMNVIYNKNDKRDTL